MKKVGGQARLLVEYEAKGLPSKHLKPAMVDMKIEIDKFAVEIIKCLHSFQGKQLDWCKFKISNSHRSAF